MGICNKLFFQKGKSLILKEKKKKEALRKLIHN